MVTLQALRRAGVCLLPSCAKRCVQHLILSGITVGCQTHPNVTFL